MLKTKKKAIVEEQGISNENIKISLSMRSNISTKISKFSDESLDNIVKPVKRKSFNLTTDNKTQSTLPNNNNSNDNFILNSKKRE